MILNELIKVDDNNYFISIVNNNEYLVQKLY